MPGRGAIRLRLGDDPGATLEILGPTDVFNPNGSDQLFTDETETAVYNPPQVRLVLADGRKIDLDRDQGGITRVEDSNGNAMTISAYGIIHSCGRSITFTRDAEGRITRSPTRWGGRSSISTIPEATTSPSSISSRNRTEFAYDARHNLLEIRDPLGRRPLRTEYDADGRLIAMIDANGHRVEFSHNVGGREEFATDTRGNLVRFVYDELGHVQLEERAVSIEGVNSS